MTVTADGAYDPASDPNWWTSYHTMAAGGGYGNITDGFSRRLYKQ